MVSASSEINNQFHPLPIFYSITLAMNPLRLCLLWMAVVPLMLSAQVVADFDPGQTFFTCSPATAYFMDQSTGPITSWSWDFGDGNSASSSSPTHTYQSSGTYTVTLTVSDGTNSDVATATITVNGDPASINPSAFSVSPQSGCFPLTVTFTIPPNYSWARYNFFFGDGGPYLSNDTTADIGMTVTHTYQSPGSYTPSMTLESFDLCISGPILFNLTVTVDANPCLTLDAVLSDLTCAGDSNGAIDVTVLTGTPPYSFTWNDGATSEDRSGLGEGTYVLTVDDAAGESLTDTFVIEADLLDVTFLAQPTNCQGAQGSLSLLVSGGQPPHQVLWNTGDTGQVLSNLPPGGYSVVVTDSDGCADQEAVLLGYADSCEAQLAGRVYLDIDGDCLFDSLTDTPLPAVLQAPDGQSWHTDALGRYSLTQPLGTSVTLTSLPTYAVGLFPACPASGGHSLPNLTADSSGLDVAYQIDSLFEDLALYLQATGPPPVPGFDRSLTLTVVNQGTQPLTPQLNWTHDPQVHWQQASPAASSYDSLARMAHWTLPVLAPGQVQVINLTYRTALNASLGDTLLGYASLDAGPQEIALLNNVDTLRQTVVAAFDPNDKQVTPQGQGQAGTVPLATEWFRYRIRFQNTGNFPATFVEIRDTLDAGFDPTTVQPLAASHAYHLNQETPGVLSFWFEDIQLPDSASDPDGSQGYVSFRVKRLATLSDGATLRNRAAIYFDFNPPILTNFTQNTLTPTVSIEDALAPDFHLHPQPATTHVWLTGTQGRLRAARLFDQTGRLLRSWQRPAPTRWRLDLQGLPSGLYILQVQTDQGVSKEKLWRR